MVGRGLWQHLISHYSMSDVPLSASCVITYFILMMTLCSKYYYSLIDEVNETQGGQVISWSHTDKKWHSQNLSPAFWFGTCYLEIPVKCCSVTSFWLFATPWIAARQAPCHHQLPEFTQTRVHRVGDAIQPSHPLSSPSPPAFGLSQHQGLFQWVSSSQQMTKALEFQLQHQSFQWIFRTDFP